ncbi:hypothetical protein HBI74_232050 [Parastagonospora nodorum]|nr:hypothetical protein HBI74_232050 [Parastagonospora nodorum]
MSLKSISGVAFVTGGARGLGNAVAVSFAREGCEAVAIVDVLLDDVMEQGRQEVEKQGAKCLALQCDVTKEEDVIKAIEKTVQAFGRIDYAANFAGISGINEPLESTLAPNFEKCVKHQIQQMSRQEPGNCSDHPFAQRGAIVNCASVNSILAGMATGPYTASKHAVVGITKTAALEARKNNIRVNALSPGFIWTDMVARGLETKDDPRLKEAWTVFEARQGRKAFPREIGDATVQLCSSKLSLVNGHNLVCDYGFVVNEMSF